MKKHDITGQRFGKLVVLRPTESTRSGMTRWECQCDCGNTTTAATKHLLKGNTKSCGCSRIKRGSAHAQWGGVGELSGDIWYNIRQHSMSRHPVPITITIEYAWNLFLQQDRRCALTRLPIYLGNGLERTASLDRIDSSKGYEEGNVQWVHKHINKMKNTFEQQYFIDMCKAVAASAQ